MLSGYTRGLDFVLGHQRTTLLVFLLTVVATGVLFVIILIITLIQLRVSKRFVYYEGEQR